MNSKKCISCKKPVNDYYYLYHNNKKYKILHCSYCDLDFYSNIKKTSVSYYEELYKTWNVAGINIRGLIWGNKVFFKKVIPYINNQKGGRVLDIGCADGLFVRELQKKQIDAYGIDINKSLIDKAKAYNKCKNVFACELRDLKNLNVPREFNVITFFDVLEHLEDPSQFIAEAKRFLSKDGYIFVSIPNRNVKPRLLPIDGDLPPHHLTWWSESALKNFFISRGFEVVFYKKEGVNPKDMAVWLDSIITKKVPLIKSAKGTIQKKALVKEDKTRLSKIIYYLKDLELRFFTAFFYLPSRVMTLLGFTGTAHCILVKRNS